MIVLVDDAGRPVGCARDLTVRVDPRLSYPEVTTLVLTPDFNQLEVNPDLRWASLQGRSAMFTEKLEIPKIKYNSYLNCLNLSEEYKVIGLFYEN